MKQDNKLVKIFFLVGSICIILASFPKNAHAMIGTQDLMLGGLFLIPIALWFWALIDILKSTFTGTNKIVWIIIVLLIPVLGALLYAIIGTKQKIKESVEAKEVKVNSIRESPNSIDKLRIVEKKPSNRNIIALIFIGICALLISVAFTKAYNPQHQSQTSSIGKVEIVLNDGQLIVPNEKVGKTSGGFDLVEPDMSSAYYEGRFAVPYTILPFFCIATIFIGLGIFLLFSKSKKEKEIVKVQKIKIQEEIDQRLVDERRKKLEIGKQNITLINCPTCSKAIKTKILVKTVSARLLYPIIHEFCKDSGLGVEEAKNRLKEGASLILDDEDRARELVAKYTKLGCQASIEEGDFPDSDAMPEATNNCLVAYEQRAAKKKLRQQLALQELKKRNGKIKCPSCHSDLSINAIACPKCGQPITDTIRLDEVTRINRNQLIIAAVVIGFILFIWFIHSLPEPSEQERQSRIDREVKREQEFNEEKRKEIIRKESESKLEAIKPVLEKACAEGNNEACSELRKY